MKKMKGFMAAAGVASSPYVVYEDRKARLKHQSLLQDYEELEKETGAVRKKLQMMKDRKLTLLAEVRFLRQRYKFLMNNQSTSSPAEAYTVQQQNLAVKSKSTKKAKSYTQKKHALQHVHPGFDLNKKGKNNNKKEHSFLKPPLFDLNQNQLKTYNAREVGVRSSSPIIDLNQKERTFSGMEATAQRMIPTFDLNQISIEEEELQVDDHPSRGREDFKRSLVKGGNDEQLNDMKLSVCRTTGNGANRVGKRKITWQDPVALRV